MRIRLDGVSIAIDAKTIVSDVDLAVAPGQVVGLIGPNGSGKSTVLRGLYRALRPVAGSIHLDADDLWALSPRQSALRTAVVAQEAPAEFDFTVQEVVTLGRTPHKRLFETENTADRDAVADSLRRTGVDHLAGRIFSTLSGGEKQRVLLAKAIAQQTRILVLDEPTNHLDIRAQLELLELVRELGVTTIAALHELNLAAAYCDQLYVLAGGRVVAAGAPDDVLTPEVVEDVFGVAVHRLRHPATERPHLAFTPLNPRSADADRVEEMTDLPTERTSS